MRMLRPFAVLLLAALVAAGCTADDQSGGPASPAAGPSGRAETVTPSGEATGDPNASARGDLEVEVLDEGAEPRRRLRLQPQNGQELTRSVRSMVAATVTTDDSATQPVLFPTTTFDTELVVTGTDEAIVVRQELVDAAVVEDTGGPSESATPATPGPTADAAATPVPSGSEATPTESRAATDDPSPTASPGRLAALLPTLIGQVTEYRLTDRGEVLDRTVTLPDDTPPEARNLFQRSPDDLTELQVVFPEEPIGEGARWTVRRDASTDTVADIDEVVTYELRSLDGDRYDVRAEIAQDAPAQDLPVGASQAPQRMAAFATRGQLRLSGTLTEPFPDAGSATITTRQILDIASEPDPQRVEQSLAVDVMLGS